MADVSDEVAINDVVQFLKSLNQISGAVEIFVVKAKGKLFILLSDVHFLSVNLSEETLATFEENGISLEAMQSKGIGCKNCTMDTRCISVVDLPEALASVIKSGKIDLYVEEDKEGRLIYEPDSDLSAVIKKYYQCAPSQRGPAGQEGPKWCNNLRVHAFDIRSSRFENLVLLQQSVNNLQYMQDDRQFQSAEELSNALSEFERDSRLADNASTVDFIETITNSGLQGLFNRDVKEGLVFKQLKFTDPAERERLLQNALSFMQFQVPSWEGKAKALKELKAVAASLRNNGNNFYKAFSAYAAGKRSVNQAVESFAKIYNAYLMEFAYDYFVVLTDLYAYFRMMKPMDGQPQSIIMEYAGQRHIRNLLSLIGQKEIVLYARTPDYIQNQDMTFDDSYVLEEGETYSKCIEIPHIQ